MRVWPARLDRELEESSQRGERLTPPSSPDSHVHAQGRTPAQPAELHHQGASVLATALLAQQLQPLNKFSGEDMSERGETFTEWIEQLEMIASVCHWDDGTKLVNLTARLRGQVYAFFRSCTMQQRGDYATLFSELKKRFTLVCLQAVQSSLFHERKQNVQETVDSYTQDLWRLFYLAYPRAQQGSQESEEMGRTVLAYQFVAGLQPPTKVKVSGQEGDFEQLLAKARFEEVKLRDLGDHTPKTALKKPPFLPKNAAGEKLHSPTADEHMNPPQ